MKCVWRIVQDKHVASQALQEALLIVWKQRQRVEQLPNPEALVLRICADVSIDELRKQYRRTTHEEPLSDAHNTPHMGENSPAEEVLRKELHEEIRKAITMLPKKQAVAIMMRIVEGYSYSDIADCLGCSDVTVRTHVKRGRLRLATLLNHLMPVTAGDELS